MCTWPSSPSRLSVMRKCSSIEQKEESRGNEAYVASIKEYRTRIETELSKICDGILKLLDSHLVPSATAAESKVFYLKMKGDYHRYLLAAYRELCQSIVVGYLDVHQFTLYSLIVNP
ncbi:unnamed protein product [Triticum turgidum subsp. durum]|uniref:14-3-3 domain-containing protein n=1 Tax=Triticum turgidum subsp. durum TaxID=4567 RepID=A0A9R0SW55_TRITD|nr:unnamed protein product [Triticum turgidum subsp. durum]